MKTLHARILFGAAFGLALALVARGQNVAQPPWRGRPALVVSRASRPRPAGKMPATQVLAMKEQGQDALATEKVPQEPPDANNMKNQPSPITVEHRGRLLVLNYGPQPGSGGLMTNPRPRGDPPGFVIFKGQRPIITGQFEYG
jgi:hypothetical protein